MGSFRKNLPSRPAGYGQLPRNPTEPAATIARLFRRWRRYLPGGLAVMAQQNIFVIAHRGCVLPKIAGVENPAGQNRVLPVLYSPQKPGAYFGCFRNALKR